jgi:acyl-coenzyme A synthetase/AMP-(fatty) acid ligase
LHRKLAGFKVPRWYEIVKELPKTPTGKIQRFKLRTQSEPRA